jgi:hypothetical protein
MGAGPITGRGGNSVGMRVLLRATKDNAPALRFISMKIVKRIFRGIIFLALAALAVSAQAVGDHIRFTQVASGTISAVLDGAVDFCKGSVVFPMGVSSVALNGNEYDITSSFSVLDPPPCPDLPQSYEVTASLGNVADGHYTVVWAAGSLNVRGTFDVRSGLLLPATSNVPMLTLPALSVLFTMIAWTGLALLRRQR